MRKIIKKIRVRDYFRRNKLFNTFWGEIKFIENSIFKKNDLYVVGMPKSASEFFYKIISDIIIQSSENINIINKVGNGKQHLTYEKTIGLNNRRQVFGVYRDLRDALISTYFYVINGRDPVNLYNLIKNMDFDQAINFLIEHKYGLVRYNNWVMSYWNKKFVHLVKFENITSVNNAIIFRNLFENINIKIPLEKIIYVLEKNSFAELKRQNPIHYKDGQIRKYQKFLSNKQINKVIEKYNKFYSLTGYQI